MNTVFLGGSRKLSRLNDAIRAKLDDLVARGFRILVGDANGADRAMQQHFAERGYAHVTLYAVSGGLRNNVGGWDVHRVAAPEGARGFERFSVKDVEMARDAGAGLMLWDGKSRGTLANVRRLLAQGKPVAVYLAPERRFVSLRSPADLGKLGLEAYDRDPQHELAFMVRDREAGPEPRARRRRRTGREA